MNIKITVTTSTFAREWFSNLAFEHDATGVVEGTGTIDVYFSDEATAARYIEVGEQYTAELTRLHGQEIEVRFEKTEIPDQDWNRTWKEQWQPSLVGEKFIVTPAWIDPENPDQRDIIRIDPKMAFGTGTHATTRLLLTWLETIDTKGRNVFDAGCGTGILAIGALIRGAVFALGVDNDPDAVDNARENAQLNGWSHETFFQTGTPETVDQRVRFGLVLANINRQVIVEVLPSLAELLADDGDLLISGILAEEENLVATAAKDLKLKLHEVRHEDEWIALHFSHKTDQ